MGDTTPDRSSLIAPSVSGLLPNVATDEAVPLLDATPRPAREGEAEGLRMPLNHENPVDIFPLIPSEGVREMLGFSVGDTGPCAPEGGGGG